ncbi:SDR family oxidoreductase [Amylibacter sp. IMCC11727]|uniref:SDR family NAD(P)-dependent oxidoreductase n=1 Tax=Amylibacter sp. IMCC11727 TaxID=3039851 RepID=UPI00244E0604|nr:SDR family oxidoreductase [Amylibacter sp. IMCC11727]WGI23298.1 SDR family NAD(P)-dependent oxidoreductase [Amylibacter sp. IMCC11727]
MRVTLDGVAVVTGGGNGIGAAMTEMLSQAGAQVAVVDIDGTAAQRVAQAVGGTGYACDVADEAGVVETAKRISTEMGAPRYLVNNAGVVSRPGQPFTDNTEEDWDRTFATNVKGAAFWAGALRDGLIAREGHIVNVTSITGVIAAPFMPPYSVSKSAANGLTRVLARQFAKDKVSVNAIAPGFVWSPLWEDLGEVMAIASDGAQGGTAQEVFDGRIRDLVPMGRPQSPEDIAALAVFLCSPFASNITGQIIGVDGGITI